MTLPETNRSEDRKLLLKFVSSLANISDLTVELLDKQLVYVRELAKLWPKYQEASQKVSFWKNTVEGLEPAEVATLFVTLGKIAELGNALGKFGTLKPEEQDNLIKDYKEATKALDELRDKLKE